MKQVIIEYSGTSDFRIIRPSHTGDLIEDVIEFRQHEPTPVPHELWEFIQAHSDLKGDFRLVEDESPPSLLNEEEEKPDLQTKSKGNRKGIPL